MDYLIKNALIIDGTGTPIEKGNILVDGDTIAGVGKEYTAITADHLIDAEEKCLCPGFIDTHSHSDISILAAPEATGKISQGVTTDIVGNCGLSLFPITNLNRDHLQKLYDRYNVELIWSSLSGYIDAVNRCNPAINIVSLCGHNTLRASICGYKNTKIDHSNIAKMTQSLTQSLKQGACGLSTGLLYVPGKFASPDEITSLLKCLQEFNLPYATHLRNEGDMLLQAVSEAIQLSKLSEIQKLHLSHLKTAGKGNWHKIKELMEIISENNNSDLSITADRYPYIESMTQLSIILPSPYDNMPDADIEKDLKYDQKFYNLLEQLNLYPEQRWQNTKLVTTSVEKYNKYLGKSLSEIASLTSIPAPEICLEMLRINSTGTMASFKGMNQNNLKTIISSEFCCCGSDESARPLSYKIGRSHPRGFGAFPEFVNILKAEIDLEKIVSKLTYLPAQIFNLKDRGLIKPGFKADLVLISPDEFTSRASFSSPHQLSEGIDKVWVNGKLSYSLNKHISRSGTYLN